LNDWLDYNQISEKGDFAVSQRKKKPLLLGGKPIKAGALKACKC
jgi:hypothetical protein